MSVSNRAALARHHPIMKYILMAYVNEGGWTQLTPEQQHQGMAAYVAYTDALTKAGVFVQSDRLGPSAAATTVRTVGGKPQVQDGPFLDSKEQLGGFFIIDVANLDAAIGWAARCPATGHGVVEVRPMGDAVA
jgi:hypothetical protein